VLLELPKGGYERKDFCQSCWEEVKDSVLEKTHIHWKSKIPEKKEESDLPKQRNARALILLQESVGTDDPLIQQEAFVLALLLARSRELFLRQELPEGNLYEVAKTEQMVVVPRLDLSRLQTEEVQKRLAEKFRD
jgi:hypothetical protein